MNIELAKSKVSLAHVLSHYNVTLKNGKGSVPWREDRHPSFGVEGDRWRDFGRNEAGDQIDFIAKMDGTGEDDARAKFLAMAGVGVDLQRQTTGSRVPINWPRAVESFDDVEAGKLAAWRGYSPELCAWLKSRALVGIVDGAIAFPVHGAGGAFLGAHVRSERGWRYTAGARTTLLAFGDSRFDELWVFESQWDLFAAAQMMARHEHGDLERYASTRGAGNGKLVAGALDGVKLVTVFMQTDAAAEKWLADVVAAVAGSCDIRIIRPPDGVKDFNDALRGGMGEIELGNLIVAAPVVKAAVEEEDRPFPFEALPGTLRNIATDIARVHQLPPAMAALAALGTLSGAIGRGFRVSGAVSGKETYLNTYVLISSPPASGKSNVARVVDPIHEENARMAQRFAEVELPHQKARVMQLGKRLAHVAKELEKLPDGNPSLEAEMRDKQAQVETLEAKMTVPRLLVGSATGAALAGCLKRNGCTLFSFSPEAGDVVRGLMGRYTSDKGGDFDLFLSGFSVERFQEHRVGRGDFEGKPCMSALWLIQPSLLRELMSNPEASERGLISRMIIANFSGDQIEHDDGKVREMDPRHVEAWRRLITRCLPFRLADSDDAPTGLQCDTEAAAILRDYHNRCVDLRNQGTRDADAELGRAREVAVKLAGLIALAGHLESNGGASGRVTADHARSGVELAEWCLEQATSMASAGRQQSRDALADRLIEILTTRGGSSTMRLLRKHHSMEEAEVRRLVTDYPKKFTMTTTKADKGGRPSVVVRLSV